MQKAQGKAWGLVSLTSPPRKPARQLRQRKSIHENGLLAFHKAASEDVANRPTLVWIDDYEPGLAVYKAIFETFGFHVLTASRGRLGLDLVASQPVHAVVVDYDMPEMDGEAVATWIKRSRPELPVVMFTGNTAVPSRVRGIVDAICDKAGSRDQLLATIRGLIRDNGPRRPVMPAFQADYRHEPRAIA
jgi:DNA-binding response OmpR family regulator